MEAVQRTHPMQHVLAPLVQRIGVAIAHVPGVKPAAPPYHSTPACAIGSGVVAYDDGDTIVITCHVVIQPAAVRSVTEHCQLIQALVQILVQRMYQRDATVTVVVTDLFI
jgi:hypothetical protein